MCTNHQLLIYILNKPIFCELGSRQTEIGRSDGECDDQENKADMLKLVRDNKTNNSKKGFLEFKFCVRPDIFDLGLNNESLFCGVVIANKKFFYPGQWMNLMMEEQKLEMVSFVPPNDFGRREKEVSFYFAVSETDDKNVLRTKPNSICASQNGTQILPLQNLKVVDNLSQIQIFVPCNTDNSLQAESQITAESSTNSPSDSSAEKANKKHRNLNFLDRYETNRPRDQSSLSRRLREASQSSFVDRMFEENSKKRKQTDNSTNKAHRNSGSQSGGNINDNSSDQFDSIISSVGIDMRDSGLTLKEIIGNLSMDKLRGQQNSSQFAELNVIVGSDICLLGETKLTIGIKTSADNFSTITHGYIVDHVDDFCWLRFRLDTKKIFSVKYSYVCTMAGNDVSVHWEKMHEEVGEITRQFSMDPESRSYSAVFDGVVTFYRQPENQKRGLDIRKTVSKMLGNVIKSFYWAQNEASLDVYLKTSFRQLLSNDIDLKELSRLCFAILRSLSEITVHSGSSKYLRLVSDAVITHKAMKIFIELCNQRRVTYDDQQSMFEHKLATIAIFTLLKSCNPNRAVLESVPNEFYEQFLKSSKFTAETEKEAIRSRLLDSERTKIVIQEACWMLIGLKPVQNSNYYPVLIEWTTVFDESKHVSLPAGLVVRKNVIAQLHSYYTSAAARRCLLMIYFKSNWDDLEIVGGLKIRADKVLNSYFLALPSVSSSNDSWSSLRSERVLRLLRHAFESANSKTTITADMAVKLLVCIGNILETLGVRKAIHIAESMWFSRFISITLDFVELFETRVAECQNLDRSFSLEKLVDILALYLGKAHSLGSFNANDVVPGWVHVMKPRAFTPYTRQVVEKKLANAIFQVICERNPVRQLHLLYNDLDKIFKKASHLNPTGVQVLFDEAIIQSFRDYLENYNNPSSYQFDLNDISKWSPKVAMTFTELACENFPKISQSSHADDVVFRMVDWKPFIPLIHLANRIPNANRHLSQDDFELVVRSFQTVLNHLDSGEVSFSTYTKIMLHLKAFEKISSLLPNVNARKLNGAMQKTKNIAAVVESRFEKTCRLNDLITKLKSENLEIDSEELDDAVRGWQQKPLTTFATMDGKGIVRLNSNFLSLEASDVTELEKFSIFLKSRIFTDMTFKKVQWFSEDENKLCTYKQLLRSVMPAIREEYLSVADSLASGNITAQAAHKRFKDYRVLEKNEEIDLMFEFLASNMVDKKQKEQIAISRRERKEQIVALDSLHKNKDFVQALLDLEEVLKIPHDSMALQSFSELVSSFFIHPRF